MLILIALVLIALSLLYLIINADFAPIMTFILVIIEMYTVSYVLIRRYNLSGEYGLILLKSRKGLDIIYSLAKHERLWNFIADTGAVVSYGLLSFLFMRKNISTKSLIAGFVLLFALSVFVAPLVFPVLSFLIPTLNMGSTAQARTELSSDFSGLYIPILILLGGGFFLAIVSGILYYGIAVIIPRIVGFLFQGSNELAQTPAGGTLLLPGINLPLFEGIAALLIILIVHEGCHAILSRIAKIKILSSGIVLFGIIPVGAFVEPDEEQLKKLERVRQTRVIVAGSTANFITALIFFILFMGFISLTAPFQEKGGFIISDPSGQMAYGTVVYSINGHDVSGISDISIEPNSLVTLESSKGRLERNADENGKIGISFYHLGGIIASYSNQLLNFIYVVLALTFVLNFIIATVNLLPLPFFDGYRTLEINLQSRHIVKGLMYLVLLAFIVNFVPWLFA